MTIPDPHYRAQIHERLETHRLIAAMIEGRALAPAARDMTPREALHQWQEANALSDHLACVELARYGIFRDVGEITADCGHAFTRPAAWPDVVTGATTDCPECGALLYMSDEFTARNFHEVMHERDARWPVSGAKTGYIEF